MVDQSSTAEIMYPDLYKGLSLRAENLMPYSSPLVSFEGKVIILKGQIRLPMQTGSVTVEVDFIVVEAYSPYTTIVADLGFILWEQFHPLCIRRLSTHLKDRLKKYWVIKPWRGSAWLQPSDIGPKLNL